MKTAHEIASEAAKLVGGDRAQQHGDKGSNFEATAVLWNAYLSIRKGGAAAPITALDFAEMMVLAKMSRIHTGSVFNMDNFVDQAGYSACAGEVAYQALPETQVAPNGRDDLEWYDWTGFHLSPFGSKTNVIVEYTSGIVSAAISSAMIRWQDVKRYRIMPDA